MVWGLLIALAGVWIALAAVGSRFSGELAVIILLGLAGLTLIASAGIAAIRQARH
jgi:hypothetical protein